MKLENFLSVETHKAEFQKFITSSFLIEYVQTLHGWKDKNKIYNFVILVPRPKKDYFQSYGANSYKSLCWIIGHFPKFHIFLASFDDFNGFE